MGATRSTGSRSKQPGITGIEPAGLALPAMDRPSVAFAWFLDRMVVDTNGAGDLFLVCLLCEELVCEIEANDTMRVLLNTALAHTCGA